MEHVEFRVRPVIRHVVTRFSSRNDGEGVSASCGPLGEFDNEGYADIVVEALRERVAPRVYAVVQETLGDETAIVHYAYDEAQADARKQDLEQRTGKSFRIYSRIKESMPA